MAAASDESTADCSYAEILDALGEGPTPPAERLLEGTGEEPALGAAKAPRLVFYVTRDETPGDGSKRELFWDDTVDTASGKLWA